MFQKPTINKNMALYEWKQEAVFYQDRISYHCSKKRWDNLVYNKDGNSMFLKISGALFGPPISDSGLSHEQNKLVFKIISKIKKHACHGNSCNIAIIYIFVFTHDCQTGCIPVFRVAQTNELLTGQLSPEMSTFIDNSGRVYNSWDHFLKTNTIKRSYICVPVKGYYSGNDDYQFIDMSSKGLTVRGIDIASTVTTVASCLGTLTGAVMTAFPPTAPIGATVIIGSGAAGLPGGLWTTGRSVKELFDRAIHEESINLNDGEARKHWIMCTASILSVGTFGAVKGIALGAQAGKTIPSAVLNVCTGLKVSTIGMTAVGLTDQIYQLASRKEKMTALDILQLSTQVLILAHGILTFSRGKAVVEEAQNQKISSFKRFLGQNDQNKFDLLVQEDVLKYSCPITGKQEMIRTLKEVDINTFLTRSFPNSNTVYSEIVNVPSTFRTFNSRQTFKMLMDKFKIENINAIVTPKNIGYLNQIQYVINLFRKNPFFKDLNTTIDVIREILLENKNGVDQLKSFDKIIQKSVEYFQKRITEMRIENPNPNSNGKNVIYHYKHKIDDELKTSKNHNEFKTFLTDLIDKSKSDPFAIGSFDQDKCDDIIDDMEGCVVPDEIKVWQLHDEDILTCSFQTKNYQNTISFFNCGKDSIYVHNQKSDTYKKYTFNIDKKINLLSFN